MIRLSSLLRRRVPGLLALFVGVGAGLASAPVARAEDAPAPAPAPVSAKDARPDAVSQLRREELDAIRRQVATWDAMSAAERERIAVVVLKLRSVSPETRAKLLERLRVASAAGPAALGELWTKLEGYRRMPHDGGERFVRVQAVVRALAAAIVAALPPERAATFYDGLSEAERGQVDGAIGNAWKRRVLDEAAAAPDLDGELPAGTPAGLRTELDAMRAQVRGAGGASAPEPMRRRLAERLLMVRLVALHQAAGPVTPADGGADPHLALAGRRLRELSPAAFDAVVRIVGEAAERGRAGLTELVEKHRGGERGDGMRAASLWRLLGDLEKKRPMLSGEVLERLDALVASVLRALSVPEEESKAYRAASTMPERLRLLAQLMETRGVLSGNGPGARVWNGRPGGPPRRPRDGSPMDGAGMDGSPMDGGHDGPGMDDDEK